MVEKTIGDSIRGGYKGKNKTIHNGLNRYRSHAFAHMASVGMTCLLRPVTEAGTTYFLKPSRVFIEASLPCHSCRGMMVGMEIEDST